MSFWTTLFNPGEMVCASHDPYGTNIVPVDDTPCTTYFSINPLHTSRKDANVTAYRNLLFELDDSDWSIEQQMQFTKDKGLPFTSAVYSGGKSVHFIVSLTKPLDSENSYRRLWKRIRAALDDKPDRSTSNPSRFSRTPGAVRVDTGREQRLLELHGRVELSELESWLERAGVDDFQPNERVLVRPPAGMKGILTKWTHQFMLLGAAQGEWNLQLFKSSCDAFRNNYDEQEWCELLEHTLGIELDSGDLKTIRSALRSVSELN